MHMPDELRTGMCFVFWEKCGLCCRKEDFDKEKHGFGRNMLVIPGGM